RFGARRRQPMVLGEHQQLPVVYGRGAEEGPGVADEVAEDVLLEIRFRPRRLQAAQPIEAREDWRARRGSAPVYPGIPVPAGAYVRRGRRDQVDELAQGADYDVLDRSLVTQDDPGWRVCSADSTRHAPSCRTAPRGRETASKTGTFPRLPRTPRRDAPGGRHGDGPQHMSDRCHRPATSARGASKSWRANAGSGIVVSFRLPHLCAYPLPEVFDEELSPFRDRRCSVGPPGPRGADPGCDAAGVGGGMGRAGAGSVRGSRR